MHPRLEQLQPLSPVRQAGRCDQAQIERQPLQAAQLIEGSEDGPKCVSEVLAGDLPLSATPVRPEEDRQLAKLAAEGGVLQQKGQLHQFADATSARKDHAEAGEAVRSVVVADEGVGAWAELEAAALVPGHHLDQRQIRLLAPDDQRRSAVQRIDLQLAPAAAVAGVDLVNVLQVDQRQVVKEGGHCQIRQIEGILSGVLLPSEGSLFHKSGRAIILKKAGDGAVRLDHFQPRQGGEEACPNEAHAATEQGICQRQLFRVFPEKVEGFLEVLVHELRPLLTSCGQYSKKNELPF
ncbi:hypothetical protein TYRP_011701 [Tyrophagus putrescentiae]|nr:hypothetical protein TYRP_011701 [Tyrophagus putrescentiae]